MSMRKFFAHLYWRHIRRKQLARGKNIIIEPECYIDRRTQLADVNAIRGQSRVINSTLGRFTYLMSAEVKHADVGSFCSIAPGVKVGGLGKHPTSWISTHPAFYSTMNQAGKTFSVQNSFTEIERTYIGNDVWLGTRAIILDGIHVSDGAIIAAGAVVTKNVPPYAVVGGVPAKIIRYRFDPETIQELLAWQWWLLDDSILSKLSLNHFTKSSLKQEDIKKLIIQSKTMTKDKHP